MKEEKLQSFSLLLNKTDGYEKPHEQYVYLAQIIVSMPDDAKEEDVGIQTEVIAIGEAILFLAQKQQSLYSLLRSRRNHRRELEKE